MRFQRLLLFVLAHFLVGAFAPRLHVVDVPTLALLVSAAMGLLLLGTVWLTSRTALLGFVPYTLGLLGLVSVAPESARLLCAGMALSFGAIALYERMGGDAQEEATDVELEPMMNGEPMI